MSNKNNKMQVDIENLFKQNVNDLSSIKELYRKLKEVEDRISKIKYIDSNLANKLKKEYEKLKRIILDENIQAKLTDDIETLNENLTDDIEKINAKLTNDIETINSQMDTKASKDDVAKISNGTPLFASNKTEMTDNTKNYVNTTDGYLYVYSEGSWTKTTVQYQSTGIEDKSITNKKLSNNVRLSPNALIHLEKNLVDIDYLNNPLSFIKWHNSANTTLIEDKINKINGFNSLNIQSNSTATSWTMLKELPYTKQGKLTFSYLRKASVLNGQNVNAVDNNDKWYGGSFEITKDYYKGWDLVKYTINIITDITSISFYLGSYKGENNYNVGLFSLVEGEYKDILPKWSFQDLSEDVQSLITKQAIENNTVTYEKLDNELKGKIDEIGVNTLDVLDYDMLLPNKIFMINEESLRLYKKNIIVNADNIRDLELSVTSYSDDDFWNNSKQPYVEYINDKIELNSENIMGNKIKFNLVGNNLKTRLGKEVEVVSRSKSEVSGKSVIVNMFGDSTSQNGLTYSVNKLLSHYVTRKLIGTKTINGAPAEARGGWLYQQYIGYRTTYSNDDKPITESDFPNFLKVATDDDKANKGDWCFTRTGSNREKTYNEIVAEKGNTSQNFYIFDYAHYLQLNSFEAPTFVTLGMGINDYWKYPDDATELCERALNIIIKQIHEASPATKFIIQPFPTKGSNDVKTEWFKKCLELETYFRDTVGVDIEIVAEHLSQNKDLFFPTTITKLNEKVANKEMINDEIHTTYEGYSEGARPIVYCMLNKID